MNMWRNPTYSGGVESCLLLLAGVCALVVTHVWAPSEAWARDPDGSRLGARQIEVGSSHSDSLAPPDDEDDWSYFQVEEKGEITIQLKVTPTSKSARLTLTKATGEEVTTVTTDDGAVTVSQRLGAGLFYVRVHSGEKLDYVLTVE